MALPITKALGKDKPISFGSANCMGTQRKSSRPSRVSAGLLMYRIRAAELEVFLAHPGGPFFQRKDDGYWSIPKGELDPGEDLLAAAIREFTEEVGMAPCREFLPLGSIQQKGGKVVHAWAFEGEWRNDQVHRCNMFELEWPPASGKYQQFAEIDRVEFFPIREARRKLKESQHPFLDRLQEMLRGGVEQTKT
jgi:predicted NUDIX family NTP pyrophosphohydrolase